MNKRQSQIYRAWENSWDYSLDHCYNSYSTAKARAWEYCEKLFRKYDGYGLKVISHNGWIFTAGFEFVDPETGEIKFMYITPSKDEIFEGGGNMKEEHTIWAVIIFILQFSVAILPGLFALFHKEIRAFFHRDSDDD